MANITNVVKSPIKGKLGTIKRSSGYEYRDFYYKNAKGQRIHVVGWHRAVDITTLGTIIAFARGKVVGIQKGVTGQTTNPSGGNSVTLEHANGCKTTYCHLDNGSNNHLKIGDIVNEGDKLGTDIKKTTGNSTGLHLHFAIYDPKQVYQNSHYVNPVDYLQGKKTLKGYGDNPTPQKKYIQLTGNVWCRTGGFGFKYPKYKVIPKNTKCELITKNIGIANGYKWDKVIYNGKTVYLPNKWNKYI